MQTIRQNLIKTFTLAISCILLCGCNNSDTPNNTEFIPTTDTIELTRAQEETNNALNAFADKLLKEAINKYSSEDQITVSPLSASICMALLANSTDKNTEKALAKILEVDDITELNSTCNKLMRYLPSPKNGAILTLANSIWINDIYTPSDSWSEFIKSNFYSQTSSLDFSNPSNKTTINDWCNYYTKGLIPEINIKLDSNILTVFANALYFKGSWDKKFSKSSQLTLMGTFNGFHGKTAVKLMTGDRVSLYSEEPTYEAFTLAMSGYEFIIVLPKDGNSINDVCTEIHSSSLLDNGTQTLIHLTLPKFKTNSTLKLSTILDKLGLPHSCSLSKMGIDENGIIEIEQKNCTSIDEDGASAAGITYTGIVTSNEPEKYDKEVDIHVTKPFIYIIRHNKTKTVIMSGAIHDIEGEKR